MIKEAIKHLFNKTGFHIVKRPKHQGSSKFSIGNFKYDFVVPSANYAPWLADVEFQKIYQEIKPNTLVDVHRCFELWELTEKIHLLDKNAGFIEIGVWRGGTAGIVGKKLSMLQSTTPFFLADTFTGVKKSTDKDSFYFDNEHSDTSKEVVLELLKNKYTNYVLLNGIFPEDTAHLIDPSLKFGLCHIDVDVYLSAKDIVDWIWNKMIIGGIIVFDDYGFHTCDGITKYVNEQKSRTDCVVVHNLNGHALMIKIK